MYLKKRLNQKKMESTVLPDILESMHQRILSLESPTPSAIHLTDVNKIIVPVHSSMPLQDCSKKVEFSIDHTPDNASLSLAMGSLRFAIAKAWFNSVNPRMVLKSIKVRRVLMFKDTTFGKLNPMAIALAELTTIEKNGFHEISNTSMITIKLRKITIEYERLTEVEGQNSVDISSDPQANVLFPDLYCIGHVNVDWKNRWEFIGMEIMESINWPISSSIFRDAASMLRKLHRCRYIHGDCHIGNFMHIPSNSKHPVLNEERIIMIDQDGLQKIPDTPENETVFKFLVLCDFNMLLLWNNPFVPFITRHNEHKIHSINDTINRKAKRQYFFITPFVLGEFNDVPFIQIKKILESHKYEKYNQFLKKTSIEEIHDFYYLVFEQEKGMKLIYDVLKHTMDL